MNKIKVTQKLLMEATRSQLINKSKKGDSYAASNQSKGKNRWERRKFSKVATQVKDFNSIDMNAFFKGDMLEFTIPVEGETDNYKVVILFEKILEEIREQVKRNNNKLEYKCILRALLRVFNSDNVYVSCNCPDFIYTFAYTASKHQYNSGTPQSSNGKGIRNPNDTKGAACKHINLCLANLNWMMKIASVINNYIWYCKDHMENNYAQYIFPQVYGMPYDKAIQLTFDSFDDKGNLIADPDLASDIETINLANALGKRRTQYKKAPEKSVNPRYIPPKKEKPLENKLGLKLDANESLNNINEEFIDDNKNIYATNNVYEVKNMLLRNDKAYRIFWDKKHNLYLIGDSKNIIHDDMIRLAIKQGYFGDLPWYEKDDYIDREINADRACYIIYTPNSLIDSTYGAKLGQDGYKESFIYDSNIITVRGGDWSKCPLSKAMDSYDKHFILKDKLNKWGDYVPQEVEVD